MGAPSSPGARPLRRRARGSFSWRRWPSPHCVAACYKRLVPKVEFEREGVVVEARPGQTLLEVADTAGVELFRGIWPTLRCGRRRGWCNRCKVWVRASAPTAINAPTDKEKTRLRLNGRVQGAMRLACQVQVNGDCSIETKPAFNWSGDNFWQKPYPNK